MHFLQTVRTSRRKKKGPIRGWGLKRSGQSPNPKCGKWTREEETPFADGPSPREEERSSVRLSQSGPEGGGDGPRHIDKDVYEARWRIQQCGKVHASHAPCARKVRRADTLSQARDRYVIPAWGKLASIRSGRKNMAPLEGRAEPQLTGAGRLQGGTHGEHGREESAQPMSGAAYRSRLLTHQSGWQHGSHAMSAWVKGRRYCWEAVSASTSRSVPLVV